MKGGIHLKSSPVIKCLTFTPNDNVGVLVSSGGKPNQIVEISGASKNIIRLKTAVSKGHKIAISEIKANEPIVKFGQTIGISNQRILPGEHVHVHNIRFSDDIDFSEKHLNKNQTFFLKKRENFPSSFKGFLRSDGRAGVRNYIVVVSTVNCAATVVKEIANYFRNSDLSKKGIDGVVPVIHSSGCAQAIDGYAHTILNRTIAGWLDHPNVVGAVVIGLGCEGTTLKSIMTNLGSKSMFNETFLESVNIQDVGGTRKAIRIGIEKVEHILANLPPFKRIELPVSLLNVALNCGGSDTFSALTANPAIGIMGDILVSRGGTIVLAEVPECHGAEKLLLQKCASKEDQNELMRIFSWWTDYCKKNNVNMNNNLSPGNIAGGISTILEKSLGAVTKGGSSPINHVIDYAERITKHGLIFMNTPGFDPVSVTGQVAGGCNLVAFTTGRGSVYGCSIAPTIKIASNSELYKKLKEDMDINAGTILTQNSLEDVGRHIYRFLIQVANGYKTCSEILGLGKEEFAPWPVGETL
ncbi:MAG: altronate dehydratase family protein [Candidatus Thermoplasmatota archaeon]|nr:altronate dehydratase family protein [Candidatus Thermoplasmatota archaeon]